MRPLRLRFRDARWAYERLKHRVLVRLGLRPRYALTVEDVAKALREAYPATVIEDALLAESSPFLELLTEDKETRCRTEPTS